MRPLPALPTVPMLARHRPPPAWPDDPVVHAGLLSRLVAHAGVVTLAAPPGHGKSMLVGQWFRAPGEARTRAWLSVNRDDVAPARLVAAIADGLAHAVPEHAAPLAAVHDPLVEVDDAVAVVLDVMSRLAAPPLIVLDNLERLGGDGPAWRVVDQLVRYLPEGGALALVLHGRVDRGLRRQEAAGRLLRVGRRDLLLAPDQLGALLAPHVGTVDDALVAEALRRTQGWPAMAWLVAREAHRHGIPAVARERGERLLADFVVEELLDRLPAGLRDRLARLAVVGQVDQAAVDHLLAGAGGGWTPMRLVHAGVLQVATDGDLPGHHPVVRDVLLRELREAGALGRWHAEAARLRLEQAQPTWAVPHLVALDDDARVREIVRDHWAQLLAEGGDAAPLLSWLADHDDDDAPSVAAATAFGAVMLRNPGLFREARGQLDASPADHDVGAGNAGAVRDVLDALAALHLDGDVVAAADHGTRALRHSWPRPTLRVMARYGLAVAQVLVGDPRAQRTVEPLLDLPPAAVGTWARSVFGSVGALAVLPHDPERALAITDRDDVAARPAEDGFDPYRHALGLTARARSLRAVGRPEEAVALHRRALRSAAIRVDLVTGVLVAETQLLLVGDGVLEPEQGDGRRLRDAVAAWARPGEMADRLAPLLADLSVVEPVVADAGPTLVLADEPPALTPAQRAVLGALVDGGTLAEVAERLGLGTETVRSHARALRRRFGVARTAQVVPAARAAGTLPTRTA